MASSSAAQPSSSRIVAERSRAGPCGRHQISSSTQASAIPIGSGRHWVATVTRSGSGGSGYPVRIEAGLPSGVLTSAGGGEELIAAARATARPISSSSSRASCR